MDGIERTWAAKPLLFLAKNRQLRDRAALKRASHRPRLYGSQRGPGERRALPTEQAPRANFE